MFSGVCVRMLAYMESRDLCLGAQLQLKLNLQVGVVSGVISSKLFEEEKVKGIVSC